VHERHSITESSEPLPCDTEGIVITVEANEVDVRESLEESLGVTAHAESGVDEDGSLTLERGGEQLDTAFEEDRGVNVAKAHDVRTFPEGSDPHPLSDLAPGKWRQGVSGWESQPSD
jgi:hypothetical protein